MKTKQVLISPVSVEEGVCVDGKVHKDGSSKRNQKKKVENAKISEYLNKLQEIVPFMPKNKRLSKMEVISYSIDYIRELRQTLGLPPCDDKFESSLQSSPSLVKAGNEMLPINKQDFDNISEFPQHQQQQQKTLPLPSLEYPYQRQPLTDILSNSESLWFSECQEDVSKNITAT